MADNQAVPRIYMAKLNEYCQRRRLRLDYKDLGFDGPSHNPVFTVAVEIDGRQYSQATGKSKKEAKDRAAFLAWESIQQELPSPEPDANLAQPASSLNYLALLNEYSSRNKVVVQYVVVSKSGLDHMPIFHCVCTIDDKDFGEGTGNNKQTAKRNAARQAYEKLNDQATSRVCIAYSSDWNCHQLRGERWKGSCVIGSLRRSCKGVPFLARRKAPPPVEKRGKDQRMLGRALTPSLRKPERWESHPCQFLDEFEDIQKIKSGGYGTVFKAKHFFDGRLLAVKRVKGKEESKKEVQALAKLEHEYIVQYYNCWIGKDNIPSPEDSDQRVEADCLFIVMEYCEKGTLKDWISKERAKEKDYNIRCVDDHSVQRTEKRGTVLYMAPEQVILLILDPCICNGTFLQGQL
uniref:Eukaryotic translation initiation factor 2 alpha kinase 2 n=1 Tax=Podarcis muralis TaxID=64176 RepID=A0A670HM75_PODMU